MKSAAILLLGLSAATYADAQASTPCKDDADCPCSYWYG